MIEKVRLSVSEETERVLTQLCDQIESALQSTPTWSTDFRQEFGREIHRVQELLAQINAQLRTHEQGQQQILKALAQQTIRLDHMEETMHRQTESLNKQSRPWYKKILKEGKSDNEN